MTSDPSSMESLETSGFLLVDKPRGITSHDAVDHIRRRFRTREVGHAGTLDPMATGLLILGVGAATKKLGDILGLPKTYEAEITLGAVSTTDDGEGKITESGIVNGEYRMPSRVDVERVLESFTGTIKQVPPVYSAIKVRGVPAHRRVRRGESVTLPPRLITIHTLDLLVYTYPLLRIRCDVSSGTYVRALARDIGEKLGCGGYLSALRRMAIGPFLLQDAVSLSALGPGHLCSSLDLPTQS